MRGHAYSAVVGALAGIASILVTVEWLVPWAQDPTTSVPGYDPTVPSSDGLVGSPACQHCHPGPRALHSAGDPSSVIDPPGEAPDGLKLAALVGSGRHRQATLFRGESGWVRGGDETSPAGKVGPGSHFSIAVEADAAGFPLTGEQAATCLRCHATGGRPQLGSTALPPFQSGIGCEACHGPGRGHVDRLRDGEGDPRAPAIGLPAVEAVRACGRCHGNSEEIPVQQGLSLARTVADKPAFGLMMSRCFTASSGPTCASCHDPHSPETATRERSEKVCGGCHSLGGPNTEKTCVEQPEGRCLDCHMVKQSGFGEDGNRPAYTDHWIRIRARDPTLRTLTTSPEVQWRTTRFAELLKMSVDEKRATPRERGLRWLRLATVLGMSGKGELAEEAGKRAVELMPDEPFALYNLGNIYLSRGPQRQDQAVEAFRKALHLSPDHLMARVRLAEVFRRSMLFDEAETALREATRVRPDAALAWMKLGEVLALRGNTEEAIDALAKALEIKPEMKKTRFTLQASLMKLERYSEQLLHLRWLCDHEGSESQACGSMPVIKRAAERKARMGDKLP